MALHKTSVKMVNMCNTVRITYIVMSYLIIAGAQGRKSEYAQFECENLL